MRSLARVSPRAVLAVAACLGLWAALMLSLARCDGGVTPSASLLQEPAAALVAGADPADPAAPDGDGVVSFVAPAPTARRARPRTQAPLAVLRAPRADAGTVVTLPPTTTLGSARVLLVLGTEGGWVHVALPTRPNGGAGWVRASDVQVQVVEQSVTVDLSARTLQVWVRGKPSWSSRVAVGAAGTPTPTGAFYVTDRVRPTDPSGLYGPFALGLSAHSDTLTSFGDGDAQIGVHGTNEPASVGRAATHGCLRLPNSVAARLADLPLGTPVRIVA